MRFQLSLTWSNDNGGVNEMSRLILAPVKYYRLDLDCMGSVNFLMNLLPQISNNANISK